MNKIICITIALGVLLVQFVNCAVVQLPDHAVVPVVQLADLETAESAQFGHGHGHGHGGYGHGGHGGYGHGGYGGYGGHGHGHGHGHHGRGGHHWG